MLRWGFAVQFFSYLAQLCTSLRCGWSFVLLFILWKIDREFNSTVVGNKGTELFTVCTANESSHHWMVNRKGLWLEPIPETCSCQTWRDCELLAFVCRDEQASHAGCSKIDALATPISFHKSSSSTTIGKEANELVLFGFYKTRSRANQPSSCFYWLCVDFFFLCFYRVWPDTRQQSKQSVFLLLKNSCVPGVLRAPSKSGTWKPLAWCVLSPGIEPASKH